jgi:hypothetical protein
MLTQLAPASRALEARMRNFLARVMQCEQAREPLALGQIAATHAKAV